MEITKEEFEQFVAVEFPGKKCHFDYKNGQGYIQIQAGNGKEFSINDVHYEFYDGQIRIHIEGKEWFWWRQRLNYILNKHTELRGEVWMKRQNCQWILNARQEDIFHQFKRIRDILEPELIAYENGTALPDITKEPVSYEEYNVNDIYSHFDLNIPQYQRIYTWGDEEVKTLLDDIASIRMNSYFIGTAILHVHNEQGKTIYDIVDGQQRLVTTALIKYVLLEKETNIPDYLERFLNCEYASLEAQTNISRNLVTIKNYIKDDQKKEKVKENINKLTFSVLIIQENKNLDLAFTFFSNTNSKGKQLTDYDLLKPHHLRYINSDLEEQQMHLAKKWDNMISSYRNMEDDNSWNKNYRNLIPYIRVMELILFRLRKWEMMLDGNEGWDHYIKKEFEAAPIIDEIPPFGEKFQYGEPIQGGQHFFTYVEHFIEQYDNFKIKDTLQKVFGKEGSNSWYETVIEALVFCYFLKFGNRYIYEATLSITRYISIIRFRKGRAYKPTILDWAKRSKITLEIDRATSPTFFLASLENRIDNVPVDNNEPEKADKGIRFGFKNNCCYQLYANLKERITVTSFINYFTERYDNIC